MQILPYIANKRGDRVYAGYIGGKPLAFSSVKEAVVFLIEHNCGLQFLATVDFEIIEE